MNSGAQNIASCSTVYTGFINLVQLMWSFKFSEVYI